MAAKQNRFPLVMKTIAIATAVAAAVLVILYRLYSLDWLLSAAISAGTTCYHFSMRLLVGAVIPLLLRNPEPCNRWFQPRAWEPSLYKALRIRQWKGSIPTYDPNQFDLTKISLSQVIRNMCNAELVHEVIVLLSWIPLLFSIPFGSFPVFAITSAAAAMYDSIFVIAQRYNRPRLMRILKKKEGCAP